MKKRGKKMKLYVQIENGIINNVDIEENYFCNVEIEANTLDEMFINPQLRNVVERKKEYYLERYKNLMEMKINTWGIYESWLY